MANFDVYIAFNQTPVGTILLNDNLTPSAAMSILIEGGMVQPTDMRELYGVYQYSVHPSPKGGNELWIVDDSRVPFVRLLYSETQPTPQPAQAEESTQTLREAIEEGIRNVNTGPVLTCPTCGSHNVRRIGAAERGFAAGLFGFISPTARSQFECMSCHYKW